jgi:hypothetical protein
VSAVEIVARVVTMTPEWAAQLLQCNEGNRKQRVRNLARIKSDILNGRWFLTGQPIIVDWNGHLLDGQHRLEMVVATGQAIEVLLVTGIDPAAMPYIDKGSPRSLGDSMRWKGAKNQNDVAAVVRKVAALIDGVSIRDTSKLSAYTDAELMDIYEELADEIQWAIPLGCALNKSIGLTRNGWAAAITWTRLEVGDGDEIVAFVEKVKSGDGLDSGSPVLALRNWSTKALASRRNLRGDELLIAFVKAWNAWCTGSEMRVLKVLPSEALPKVEVP